MKTVAVQIPRYVGIDDKFHCGLQRIEKTAKLFSLKTAHMVDPTICGYAIKDVVLWPAASTKLA